MMTYGRKPPADLMAVPCYLSIVPRPWISSKNYMFVILKGQCHTIAGFYLQVVLMVSRDSVMSFLTSSFSSRGHI
jgi:hypothetical protein